MFKNVTFKKIMGNFWIPFYTFFKYVWDLIIYNGQYIYAPLLFFLLLLQFIHCYIGFELEYSWKYYKFCSFWMFISNFN